MVGLNGEVMIGIAVLNTGLYPPQFVGSYPGRKRKGWSGGCGSS